MQATRVVETVMEILVIEQFLTCDEVAETHAIVSRCEPMDGALTAGRYARPVKRAQTLHGPEAHDWCARLVDRIFNCEKIAHFAFPHRAVQPSLVSYSKGEGYGPHDDNPLQAGMRTDFSFTLFLASPEDYSGGGLVLTDANVDKVFKPAAGTLVLYKTGIEHYVETVSEGVRTVAIGWLQSIIRDSAQRVMLRDFSHGLKGIEKDVDIQSEPFRTLNRVRNELMRRWAET